MGAPRGTGPADTCVSRGRISCLNCSDYHQITKWVTITKSQELGQGGLGVQSDTSVSCFLRGMRDACGVGSTSSSPAQLKGARDCCPAQSLNWGSRGATCAVSRPSLEDMPTPRGCKALASEPTGVSDALSWPAGGPPTEASCGGQTPTSPRGGLRGTPEPIQVSEDTGPQAPLPTVLCRACSALLAPPRSL